MTQDASALYSALVARDARFDGVFYVGVTSTRIYCRPVCTAKTPKAPNCRFFDSREAAEKSGFRPCLRCRPELAPGNAPVDDSQRIAALIAQRIDEGLLDDGAGLERISRQFGWSSRQIRRMVQKELGVSPIELVLTRRLLLAKQLLTETVLPITDVAYASGFSSIRRFNDAFGTRYGMAPTRFRKTAERGTGGHDSAGTFTLRLGYRAPFDWEGILRFLGARALEGVEHVSETEYARTVRLGKHTGWVRVRNDPERRSLLVEITHSLTPVLPALLGRLRNLFDLNARPDVIGDHLRRDRRLKKAVEHNPGLRVPGAFDGFELALRAVLGQQVTVKGATTLAGRLVARFGEPVMTPLDGLDHLSPLPEAIARASAKSIAAAGIVTARAEALIAIAREIAGNHLVLDAGGNPEEVIARLMEIRGIGAWTSHYIAMRALRWPDAFPKEDVALRKRLGGVTPAEAEAMSHVWRPWRSYAILHLWEL